MYADYDTKEIVKLGIDSKYMSRLYTVGKFRDRLDFFGGRYAATLVACCDNREQGDLLEMYFLMRGDIVRSSITTRTSPPFDERARLFLISRESLLTEARRCLCEESV